MYKEDLALNNQHWLICHKAQPKQIIYNWYICQKILSLNNQHWLICHKTQPNQYSTRSSAIIIDTITVSIFFFNGISYRSLSELHRWERYESPYPPSYGLNSTTSIFTRTNLALNNRWRLISHETNKQNLFLYLFPFCLILWFGLV